jgi:hypothetical protein
MLAHSFHISVMSPQRETHDLRGRDGFTGGGGGHPLSPGQMGCRGGAIFHDKAKNY